jgi:DNA-binding MarR family transcriptional regulator
MTTTRPAPLFGQSVGEAQRALRALVDRVFDDAGTSFETWIVLNTLATQGPAIPEAKLREDLEYGLSADPNTVTTLLDDLRSNGLIRFTADSDSSDGRQVELSSSGAGLHQQLREAIVTASNRVTADIDTEELATTVNVLTAVKARAEALLDREAALAAER